jgi:glycosyltransferase involved in cell wall biosynthesis
MNAAPLGMLVKIWPKLSETFILEEVLALERQGVPLRLYALAPPTDEITHPVVETVRAPLVCVPGWHWREAPRLLGAHGRCLWRSPSRWARTAIQALRQGKHGLTHFVRAAWLGQQLLRDGVPHLHVHFISTTVDVASLACSLTGIPFSISAHAKDIYLSRTGDLRRKLLAARFTVTCTEANLKVLAHAAPEAVVHRMYHGIDHQTFHPARRESRSASTPTILAVGRLRAKKGLDTLIEACRLLQLAGFSFACEIVGYGEEHARLAALIDRAGLQGRVRLLGKLARADVLSCYARAAVFVQPSRITADGDRDGIPNVLLEAMSMGLPVVASRVSGIPELVEDRASGLLVAPDDPQALAHAIVDVLEQPERASGMGRAARARVKATFDNDTNLALLLTLLNRGHTHDTRCAHC